MSNKRGNSNSQLSREEYEAQYDDDGEDGDEPGVFTKASEDEMRARKIVKVRRPGTAGDGVKLPPSTAAPNPFGGIQLAKPTAEDSARPNPFAGFTGLSAPPTKSFQFGAPATTTGPSASTSTNTSTLTGASVGSVGSSSSLATSAASVGGDGEYGRKIKKLNATFLAWADRQVKTNVMSVWKEGVRDYLAYQRKLKERFPQDAAAATATAPAAAPAATQALDKIPTTAVAFHSAPAAAPAPASTPSFSFGATPVPAAPSSSSGATAAPFTFSSAAPAAPVATGGFSFGAPVAAPAPAPAAAPQPFSFSAAPPALPSTSFSFGAAPTSVVGSAPFAFKPAASGPLSAAAAAPAGAMTFSFAPTPAAPAAAAASSEDADGGDDEGEPILPPEKVLRNSDDKDEILLDVPCKLLGYNLEEKEWRDMGKGSFRLTRDPTAGKKRMLVRNTMGRITFNAAFYKSMKVERAKGGLRFSAFVAVVKDVKSGASVTELKNFMVKMKDFDVDTVKAQLEAAIAEL